jgi:hypothetical protein
MPNEEARRVYLTAKNKRLVEATVECKSCGGTSVKEVVLVPAVEEVPEVPAVEEERDEVGGVSVEAVAAVPAVPAVPKQMGEEPCGTCEGTGGTSELDDWIKGTDRFSIAHLKELIVSVEVFEVELAFALKRLSQMLDSPPKSSDVLKTPGQYT